MTTEAEDDILLLNNAAAASLLSPTLWLSGARPRTQRRAPANPETRQHHSQQSGEQAARLESLEGEEGDEEAEMEQLREDLQRLSALEEMYTKLKLQNSILEHQLLGIYSAVNGVLEENRSMKRLISLLQVRREDFVVAEGEEGAADQQQQEEGMEGGGQEQPLPPQFLEAVGRRLLGNMLRPAPQQAQQLHAAAAAQAGAQEPQRQQQPPVAMDAEGEGAVVLPGTPKVKAALAALQPDSPKIAAHREGQQLPAYRCVEEIPEEMQIAAAVLATTRGDPSAALLTLLDRAMAARHSGPSMQ